MVALETEYLRWRAYWQRQSVVDRSDSVAAALHAAANLGTYSVITVMLRIFATIPLTTANGESSFSSLKNNKNYVTFYNEWRLNGLSQMYINRDTSFDYNHVVDEFAKGNHRINFN